MGSTQRRTTDYRIHPFDLHLFAAVLEHGTITAAAQAVNLSLPAASARLKALEDATGSSLLQRSKSGAAPTAAGRALARHANRVLAELESLHVEMAGFGQGLRGTVRLRCNTAAMVEGVPTALGRFLVRNPDIDIDVQEQSSDAVLDALRSGVADLGVVADYVDTSGLIAQPWREDRLVALVPSPWQRGKSRSASYGELLQQPMVGLPRDSGLSRFLATHASRSGRVPRHRVRLDNLAAIAAMVAAGVGVAVVPQSVASRHVQPGTRIVPLRDSWACRHLLVCMTPNGSAFPGVRQLAQALLDAQPSSATQA